MGALDWLTAYTSTCGAFHADNAVLILSGPPPEG